MKYPYRWIVCDVDDTVCPSTEDISKEMAVVIDDLMECMIGFLFISGSPTESIQCQVSEHLYGPHFIMGVSGAHLRQMKLSGKTQDIWKHVLLPDQLKEITEASKKLISEFKIISLTTEDDQLQNRGCQVTISALGRKAPKKDKEAFDPDRKKRAEYVQYLKSILPKDKYHIGIGGSTSIDITVSGINKGTGLVEFAHQVSTKLNEILYIGDSFDIDGNDYSVASLVDFLPVRDHLDTLEFLKEYQRT